MTRDAMSTKSHKRMTPCLIQGGALLPSSKALMYISDSISIVRQHNNNTHHHGDIHVFTVAPLQLII
jgi:hypothetical protein